MDDAFGNWLAGFADGEGCFQVRRRCPNSISKFSYECIFGIGLRSDDLEVLHYIQQTTGLGKVYISRGKRAASWRVYNKKEILILVEIFDRYPLRAKKQLEYLIWRRAVIESANTYHRAGGKNTLEEYEYMKNYMEILKNLRIYKETVCT